MILKPSINDLNYLQSCGITVQNEHFHVHVVAFVVDNLSCHRLAGLNCSFSSGRVCRFCLAMYGGLNKLHSSLLCVRRIAIAHASHQAAFLLDPIRIGSLCGIKSISPLATLTYFDVTQQLLPDAMHDVLEGGIQFVLKAVMKGLYDSGFIQKEDVKKLKSFLMASTIASPSLHQ